MAGPGVRWKVPWQYSVPASFPRSLTPLFSHSQWKGARVWPMERVQLAMWMWYRWTKFSNARKNGHEPPVFQSHLPFWDSWLINYEAYQVRKLKVSRTCVCVLLYLHLASSNFYDSAVYKCRCDFWQNFVGPSTWTASSAAPLFDQNAEVACTPKAQEEKTRGG